MKDNKDKQLGRVSLYPPTDLLEKLKDTAQKNHRSLNGELLYALEQYIAQQKQQ